MTRVSEIPAVSSDGASLAGFRATWKESKRQYLRVTVAEVYKLWKSMSKSSHNLELANARLIERLEKYRENRIKVGLSDAIMRCRRH